MGASPLPREILEAQARLDERRKQEGVSGGLRPIFPSGGKFFDTTSSPLPTNGTEKTEEYREYRESREEREKKEDEEHTEERESERKPEISSIQQAVEVALPTAPGQNRSCLLTLARGLLSLQKHFGRTLTDKETDAVFDSWYAGARPFLRQGKPRDEYFFQFLTARELAKYPLGEGRTLQEALNKAAQSTPPPEAVGKLSDTRLITLVCLCRELQRRAGDKPFYLACRTVSELFKLKSNHQAHDWLRGLVRLKILEVVENGTPGPRGKATRFRYLLEIGGPPAGSGGQPTGGK